MRNATLERLLNDLANHPRTIEDFLAKGDWMPFLPVLEFTLDEVQAKMPRLFASKFPNSASEFSCGALVEYALRWPSSYWRELAVEWIAQGLPISERIAAELESFVKDKHVAQKSRHKVGPLLNQWKRAKSQHAI
jgi:hypothetical protein